MTRYREVMRLSALGQAPRAVAAAGECNESIVRRPRSRDVAARRGLAPGGHIAHAAAASELLSCMHIDGERNRAGAI